MAPTIDIAAPADAADLDDAPGERTRYRRLRLDTIGGKMQAGRSSIGRWGPSTVRPIMSPYESPAPDTAYMELIL